MTSTIVHSPCPPALGEPEISGIIRAKPEHFQVVEELGFEPGVDEGYGEHLWLYIEKTNWNTLDVAAWLADQAKVPVRNIGLSGLKDRNAQTWQWFSVQLPGKPDPEFLSIPDGLKIHQQIRHGRKLNRGTHRFNRFRLLITGIESHVSDARDVSAVDARLNQIHEQGVPNYFGVQRFGRESRNLERAVSWLCEGGEAPRKRANKSLWLSALRSELFNRVLALRVEQGNWNKAIAGDVLQPVGSRGLFFADEDENSQQRVNDFSVNPTAPLPGVGGLSARLDALAIENMAFEHCQHWCQALVDFGVESARRATRLQVHDLSWQWQAPADVNAKRHNDLLLEFVLPAGCFATTVLAELININRK